DIAIAGNSLLLLAYSTVGSYTLNVDTTTNILYANSFDHSRYRRISFNKHTNSVTCYTDNRIMVHRNATGEKEFYSQSDLEKLGIKKLDKILVDSFGNVIIKAYNSLFIYELEAKKLTQYFKNYNLENAFVDIQNGVLTI